MVLERALAAAGDEDDLLDPGLERLLDRILDERPVDDRSASPWGSPWSRAGSAFRDRRPGRPPCVTFFIVISGKVGRPALSRSGEGRKRSSSRSSERRRLSSCRAGLGDVGGGVSSSSVVGAAGAWAGLPACRRSAAGSSGSRLPHAASQRERRQAGEAGWACASPPPIAEAAAAGQAKIRSLAGRASPTYRPRHAADPAPASASARLRQAPGRRDPPADQPGWSGPRGGRRRRPAGSTARMPASAAPAAAFEDPDGEPVSPGRLPGQARCWSISGRPGARPASSRCRRSTRWPSARTRVPGARDQPGSGRPRQGRRLLRGARLRERSNPISTMS